MEHDIISIVHCACCKYAEPFPTDPRVLICANPKWVPTGDGRGVKEPYVKPDDYCSFGEEKDNEDETAECVIRTQAADPIEALEKQLAETDAIAEHEHCRYIETLGECDGMEARCKIVEKQLAEKESEIVRIRNSWSNTISDLSGVATERDKYKASLGQIKNLALGFMESGPYESEALSGLWLVNQVISLALAPLEENRDGI